MPDQSLSNDAVSGKTGQEAGNPADTTANSPTQATPESQASNVTIASEGEQQQADVTINQDPHIGDGPADDYDDEEKWPYRALQQEAKGRELDASGKREEIVARLRGGSVSGSETPRHLQGVETTDADTSDQPDAPRQSVPSEGVEHGGIQRTGRAQDHAEVLQGMSDARRQQQLAAVKERAERSEA